MALTLTFPNVEKENTVKKVILEVRKMKHNMIKEVKKNAEKTECLKL